MKLKIETVKMEEKGDLAYLSLAEFEIVHWFFHNKQSKLEVKCFEIWLKLQMVCFDFYFELYIGKISIYGFLPIV